MTENDSGPFFAGVHIVCVVPKKTYVHTAFATVAKKETTDPVVGCSQARFAASVILQPGPKSPPRSPRGRKTIFFHGPTHAGDN